MKRPEIILILLLTMLACKKEAQEVSFSIKPIGFDLENAYSEPDRTPPEFTHKLNGGLVTFTRELETFTFDLENSLIEDYTFSLPTGHYQVNIIVPPASIYGQAAGSFKNVEENIILSDTSDTISIQVEANCALFLVSDENQHLDQGVYMIERHAYANGYFIPYPLHKDSASGLFYTYFSPDTNAMDPSAYLWFYDDTPGSLDGGLPTFGLENGYQYFIKILE